jgi:hypothetical protein
MLHNRLFMNTSYCRNCQTKRRRVQRAGFCAKCYHWQRKRANLQKQLAQFASSDTSLRAFRLREGIRDADRILEEYAWRERPLNTNEVDPLAVEALFNTIATECRSTISFGILSSLNAFSSLDRMCLYGILLEIVENIPASRPRFHTLKVPERGSYLRSTR